MRQGSRGRIDGGVGLGIAALLIAPLLACGLLPGGEEGGDDGGDDTTAGTQASSGGSGDGSGGGSSSGDTTAGSGDSGSSGADSTTGAPSCDGGCAQTELCYQGTCSPIGFSRAFGGGSSRQAITDIALDPDGNLVVVGFFDDFIELDATVLEGEGLGLEAFAAKLDPTGAPIWARAFVNTDAANEFALGVDVGADGTIAIVGELQETVDFGTGPLSAAGDRDVFVLALGPDGTTQWAQAFGDAGAQLAAAVAVLPDGGIAVTGSFFGTIDLGGGPLTSEGDATDVFVAVLEADGSHRFSTDAGDDAYQYAHGLAVADDGTLAVCGEFEGTLAIAGGSFDADVGDLFLATFAADGAEGWAVANTDPGYDSCHSVAFDGSGRVGITGRYAEGLDYGGQGGVPNETFRAFKFASVFDAGGAHVWSRGFGSGTWPEMGGDTDEIAFDGAGNMILTGALTATADFGGGVLPSDNMPSVFVAKLGGDGTHVWSQTWVSPELRQVIGGVAIDQGDAIVLGGEFAGELDLGFGPMVAMDASADALLARMLP